MKEITVEGMKYLYFTRSDGLPSEILKQNSVNPDAFQQIWQDTLSKQAQTFRLVLIPSAITRRLILYYLYWIVDQDLDTLDQKVESNSFSDEDFKAAVATRFGKLKCSNCAWQGYTFVLSLSDVYISAAHLEEEKLKLVYADDDNIKKCPHCGSRLRQIVLKIFLDE